MKITECTYNPIGAFYFKLKEPQGKIKHATEVDATVIVDEDETGQMVGIEVLLHDKEIIDKISEIYIYEDHK